MRDTDSTPIKLAILNNFDSSSGEHSNTKTKQGNASPLALDTLGQECNSMVIKNGEPGAYTSLQSHARSIPVARRPATRDDIEHVSRLWTRLRPPTACHIMAWTMQLQTHTTHTVATACRADKRRIRARMRSTPRQTQTAKKEHNGQWYWQQITRIL